LNSSQIRHLPQSRWYCVQHYYPCLQTLPKAEKSKPSTGVCAVCTVFQQQLYGESRNSLVLVKMIKRSLGLEQNFQKCSSELKVNLSKFSGL